MQNNRYELLLDNNLRVLQTDDAFYEHIGQRSLKMLDDIIPPQDLMLLKNALFALGPGEGNLCCFRMRTSTGKLNWNAANLQKANDESGQIQMELEDIQSFRKVKDSALYDPMTGLYNKQSITDYAHEMVENPGKGFYFALLDIDHFKRVNDTLGHKKGDEVIIDVAHMIRDIIGDKGRVGRIGGDEFMLVLDQIHERPALRVVMNELRETIEEKYAAMEDALHITISVGVTLYPDYSDDYEELFSLTDKLLYRAKEKGRNRYVIYTPEVHAAIRNKEEAVALQPQRIYTENMKNRLIMDLMDRFLMCDNTNIDTAMSEILKAYNLDEIYISYDDEKDSRYGVKKNAENENGFDLSTREFPFLQGLNGQYNENSLFSRITEDYTDIAEPEIRTYMQENQLRFLMVYRMAESRVKGCLIYMNALNSACRPSESDISDLLYFARMMELVMKTR
ncbi:MAG: GGDEF domain-containing protein [Lachnospiraceae bacterium]|nr:GGDEF domain-containing protein [Lachnospiraceae bacterium]